MKREENHIDQYIIIYPCRMMATKIVIKMHSNVCYVTAQLRAEFRC